MIQEVILNGFCIGCGACTAIEDSPISIKLDTNGLFTAVIQDFSLVAAPKYSEVCPFADLSLDESKLGNILFSKEIKAVNNPYIGYHLENYVGYVQEGNFRNLGSGGGVARWILSELLILGEVDAIIQVVSTNKSTNEYLFEYSICASYEDILMGSKSAYYPVEMSGILDYVKKNPGRYAIIGVPCFIKSIRLLQKEIPVFRERIKFCLSIFCGHLKSKLYADMLGWQLGIIPGSLSSIDFRVALEDRPANEKGILFSFNEQNEQNKFIGPINHTHLFGAHFSYGFFQYKACNYCDDVVGETADVSIGDAWLPDYVNDSRGTSIIIVRNSNIKDILDKGILSKRLSLQKISVDKVIASQAGGFRQRREGLVYRLFRLKSKGEWVPKKRVSGNHLILNKRRKILYTVREEMSKTSFAEFKNALIQGEFSVFIEGMQPLIQRLNKANMPNLRRRIFRGIIRRVPILVKKYLIRFEKNTPFHYLR